MDSSADRPTHSLDDASLSTVLLIYGILGTVLVFGLGLDGSSTGVRSFLRD